MKLISVDEFRERYFTEASRPDPRTVRAWVEDGHVPGRVIGPKRCYIDRDAWEAMSTGDALADKVLRKAG